MNGLNKPIEVRGKAYNNIMPGHAFLKDGDLADVLTYIRSHFCNEASPVTPEEIAAFRKKIARRP